MLGLFRFASWEVRKREDFLLCIFIFSLNVYILCIKYYFFIFHLLFILVYLFYFCDISYLNTFCNIRRGKEGGARDIVKEIKMIVRKYKLCVYLYIYIIYIQLLLRNKPFNNIRKISIGRGEEGGARDMIKERKMIIHVSNQITRQRRTHSYLFFLFLSSFLCFLAFLYFLSFVYYDNAMPTNVIFSLDLISALIDLYVHCLFPKWNYPFLFFPLFFLKFKIKETYKTFQMDDFSWTINEIINIWNFQ